LPANWLCGDGRQVEYVYKPYFNRKIHVGYLYREYDKIVAAIVFTRSRYTPNEIYTQTYTETREMLEDDIYALFDNSLINPFSIP